MQNYIIFLRAINVAGKNKLKMQDLKLALENEYPKVQTYIQSGNIVIPHCKFEASQIKFSIEKTILETFDIKTIAIVKSALELKNLLANIPFPSFETNQLYFSFLANGINKAESVSKTITQLHGDNFKVYNDMVYIQCLNGYGKTKLSNQYFEKKFKTLGTTRNYNTISKLIDLASKA